MSGYNTVKRLRLKLNKLKDDVDRETNSTVALELPPSSVTSYTPFTRSSKHRAIIEQTSSKCIQNTRARRVL